jgi:hypothetical protein
MSMVVSNATDVLVDISVVNRVETATKIATYALPERLAHGGPAQQRLHRIRKDPRPDAPPAARSG